jgi:predicted permease
VTTFAAVVSLGLALGSCVAAFRLVDALFLRPMPVSHPEGLYSVWYDGFNMATGAPRVTHGNSYPLFRQMQRAVAGQAQLMAASNVERSDLTFGTYQEVEQASVQEVSGEVFPTLGLRPALGRLLNEEDDRAPGASPYAVLSYEYWTQRLGADPKAIGRTFRLNGNVFEIVGVAPQGFIGTEPGRSADFFIPISMDPSALSANNFGLYILARPAAGAAIPVLQSKLDEVFWTSEKERAKGFVNFPKHLLDGYPNAHLRLKAAGMGASELQNDYRSSLVALCVLVGMVLLIACVNVTNLMNAQAAARVKEMALRMSIGAGRWRVVRLMMVESMMLAVMAAVMGMVFAWWAAPFVVRKMSSAGNPVRLALPADWTMCGFALLLVTVVTLLFGLMPALRVFTVQVAGTLKGGEESSDRRVHHGLIGVQVAFCFVVLFVAGLFGTTFRNLISKSVGFRADHLLLMQVQAQPGELPERWGAMLQQVRTTPGVDEAAMSEWALASGPSNNNFIHVNGQPDTKTLSYLLAVSPGWLQTMRIPLKDGRDLRDSDLAGEEAVVNETFVKQYFAGQNPVGRSFSLLGSSAPTLIVGVVGDAVYRDLREATLPQIYQPIWESDGKGARKEMRFTTLIVRTGTDDPIELAETVRKKIVDYGPSFRVSGVRTETEVLDAMTVKERMLASLGAFFAGVALLLAVVGLYGVLHYSVVQREREIGIRIALGAAAGNIARIVTGRVLVMVLVGAGVGLAAGVGSVRFVQSLLYGVRGTDLSMMVLPGVVLLVAAVLAALPAVLRAVRIDPAVMLRSE